METQDALNAEGSSSAELREEFKKTLAELAPITDNAEVMGIARQYIQLVSPRKDQMECEEVIGVFLRVFTNMSKSVRGEQLSTSEVEQLFMSETLMLELNNTWYRAVKPILDPIIAECKVSLMTALVLKTRDEELRHESDDDTIWALTVSSWDFLPWVIFMATGNIKAYISSKEMFTRMIVISKDKFGLDK